MATTGFWSYVHADDDSESGRIRALAEDLAAQYEAITTEPVQIFVDRSSLGWGDDWDTKIEEAVVATSFFVPVVSPRYLASEACRRELRLFEQKASQLGLRELIMPLVWFDVPELADPNPTDDLVTIVKRFQWVDWRDLRFEERSSAAYRRAVSALAQRLADISARLAESTTPIPAPPASDPSEDGTLGQLDLLAAAEQAIPAWTADLVALKDEIATIGELTQVAGEEMRQSNSKPNPFAARLTAARKYSQVLEPHAQRIEELGNEFTTHLYGVDGGIRATFSQARIENLDANTSQQFSQFAQTIMSMADASRTGLGSLQGLVDAIQPVESMSRDLRPALVKLRRGLTVMVEGQRVIDEWARLADEAVASGVVAAENRESE